METNYEIEHHIDVKSILPTREQVCRGVKIVQVREKGEFLMEKDIDNKKKINLTFGGLVVSLDKKDFVKELTNLNRG